MFLWGQHTKRQAELSCSKGSLMRHLDALLSAEFLDTAALEPTPAASRGSPLPCATTASGVTPWCRSGAELLPPPAAVGGGDAAWARCVLGASPEATEVATSVATGMRELLWRLLLNHLVFHDGLVHLLDAKQLAVLKTHDLPQPDLYRIAVLACTSVVQEHATSTSLRWTQ